mmetsp:Transcript_24732/g.36250  ORF Transcript_24732/g.36250 Transcript_24732/m.36250 type:complete len:249 (-) Transcript_24732:1527-2273(-)
MSPFLLNVPFSTPAFAPPSYPDSSIFFCIFSIFFSWGVSFLPDIFDEIDVSATSQGYNSRGASSSFSRAPAPSFRVRVLEALVCFVFRVMPPPVDPEPSSVILSQSEGRRGRSSTLIVCLPGSPRTVATCVGANNSQKGRLCVTTTMVPLYSWRASVRTCTVDMSKWFEGSSRMSKLCGTSTNMESATRAFSPPDMVPIFCSAFVPVSPNAPITARARSLLMVGSFSRTFSSTTSMATPVISKSCAKS